jgi:hypothetical protein
LSRSKKWKDKDSQLETAGFVVIQGGKKFVLCTSANSPEDEAEQVPKNPKGLSVSRKKKKVKGETKQSGLPTTFDGQVELISNLVDETPGDYLLLLPHLSLYSTKWNLVSPPLSLPSL